MGATVNLTHHFLIAMPSMADPNFAHTLTYVCEHNPDGALGLVVNRPIACTPRGMRLCRPSEAVLDLLDRLPEGPFHKDDGEPVIDEEGRRVV